MHAAAHSHVLPPVPSPCPANSHAAQCGLITRPNPQVNDTGDYPSAFKVQDGFKLTPLGQYGKPAKAAAQAPFVYDQSVNMTGRPADIVAAMSGEGFFTYGAELMALHRPHATDWSMAQGLRKLGIDPGKVTAGVVRGGHTGSVETVLLLPAMQASSSNKRR